MKTVLSSVLIIFLAGLLHGQDVPPGSADLSADLSGAVAKMQGSADLILVSSIAEGVGLGFGTLTAATFRFGIPFPMAFTLVSGAASAVFVPAGYLASSIAYCTVLDEYNRVFPSDPQNAVAYLLLTLGGTVATVIGFSGIVFERSVVVDYFDSFPSSEEMQEMENQRNFSFGIGLAGVAASLSGIIVSVVHSQELLAKTKSVAKKAVSAPSQQVIVTPQIGIGSFGVAISMP